MQYDLMAVIGVLAVMWASSLGCGLAVERILRVRISNGLLLALGLCASIVLTLPGYAAGAGDALAIVLLVVVTLAGLVFAQGGLRTRLNPGWPGLAALAAYILYMLPVIASGHWTWSGYDFVNDSSFEMLLAEHIKGYGAALGNIPETSEREFLKSYLGTGYPLGTQALLGTFSGLTDTPVAVLYQGLIAGMAAAAAAALSTLTSRLLGARRAALIAFVAISANLTYQYALQGGIKEIGLVATLCATAALAREAISLGRPYAGAALVAVGAAASLGTYNAVAAPYLGALALFLALAVLLVRRAPLSWRWVGPTLAGGALTAVLAIPALTTLRTFFNLAQASQGSTGVGATQFGQLLRALPLSQVSGVWLAGEYRLPVIPEPAATLTVIATVAILALIVPSVLWALRRREPGPLLLFGVMALVLLIVYPRVSPYAQGKLLAIAGPAVLLAALVGLAAVRGRLAPLALLLGGALAVAVWGSDLLAYSRARIAPIGRIEAITQTGEHFKGQGPVLWNEFEEYAKYFARAARISVPFEALTPRQVVLRKPTFFYGHYFDLDEEVLPFVEAYPIIVTRRSPSASRPPANYKLAYQNRYYLGWRRTPLPRIVRHLPEQRLYSPSSAVSCSALRRTVANAPSGTELMAAVPPELAWFEPLYSRDRSVAWGLDPAQKGAVIPNAAGHASGVLRVGARARYAVWVQGDFPRPIYVRVDGRIVGSVSGSNTPGQWLKAASVYLSPGRHKVVLLKLAGHDHLGPGEWDIGTIGAAALQRETPERLETLPVRRWRSLCGTQLDWVELVRP
ncbi:MAG TPA: hypothetical protein VHU13_00455 [Solirubrobacteraceae bacterium]|nr:hypothetical protein [Solirubrobacteraceae bacterium]